MSAPVSLAQARDMFPKGSAIEYVGPIARLRGRIFDVDMVSDDGEDVVVYFSADGRWAWVPVAHVQRPGAVPHRRIDHTHAALVLSTLALALALLAYVEALR